MIHRKLLISVIGLTVIVCVCSAMGWCYTEQQGSVSIYELLKQKAKTHNWRTLLVGWDRLVMFDFGLHEPMFVYQLQRGSSGYYEADIEGGVLSPDASRVAFSQKDDKLRKTNLDILDLSNRSVDHLLRTDKIDGIAWSPDGQQIAYIDSAARDEQFELHVLDLSSRQSKSLLRGGGHYVIMSQSWSPDGRQLVYGLSQKEGGTQMLMIYDLASKTSRRLITSGKWATWSPSGEWIAYLAFDKAGKASIRLISPDGRRKTTLLQDATIGIGAIATAALWSPDGAYLLYGRVNPQDPEALRSHVFELSTSREETLPEEIYWAHSFAGKR